MVGTGRPDHVALLFGASRGIGAAAAEAFARRGAQVCLAARSEAKLSSVQSGLRIKGHEAWIKPCDITDAGQVTDCVTAVVQAFGRIDTVIDFAALTGPLDRATWELDTAEWSKVMATNLDGVFHILRASIPALERSGQGRVLLASSPFGDSVTPGLGAYAASRAASHALVRQAAAELQGTGVGAAIVHPGMTETEGLADFRAARGGATFAAQPQPVVLMANLFVWAALQAPQDINGALLSWSDPQVRNAVLALPPG